MSSRSNVGGVFSVEMWLSNECGGSNPLTLLEDGVSKVEIPIISSLSGYTESVEINGGIKRVVQTLTLVTYADDDFWQSEALSAAERVGCIAEANISSLGCVILGWSPTLGYDQPLRLKETIFKSGDAVNKASTKTWVFRAYATTSLI